MQNLFNRMMPFIVLGIMIVALVFGFILLSYLLIGGAVIGLILFVVAGVKEKFFPAKKLPTVSRRGRTFDHRDY